MTTKITDPDLLRGYAMKLGQAIDQAVDSNEPNTTPTTRVMKMLHHLFCDITPEGGFTVKCFENFGPHVDILADTSLEDWMLIASSYDGDRSNWSLFSPEDAKVFFIELLTSQVTTNVPKDIEEARRHFKMMTYSLFNSANPEAVKFDLVYTDYSFIEDHWGETDDLGDFLLV